MEVYGDPGFVKHVRRSSLKSLLLPQVAALQVTVAQHLGLQLLRIADSWVLPINTTHYSIELQSYLDKSAPACLTSFSSFSILFPRVEDLADKSSIKSKVDFHKLRNSLSELREASLRLDEERVYAYWQLKKALWKLHHRRAIRHWFRRTYCKVRRWFGKKCHPKHGHGHKHKQRIGRFPRWIEEQGEQGSGHRGSHHRSGHNLGHGHCDHGRKEVALAAKHVRDVNNRLSKFEQGFISEDGIKDREWYRHLGVAPGKWLGPCWFHIRLVWCLMIFPQVTALQPFPL